MIINGGSRSNGAFFARHLMRVDDNERVSVPEMRGFAHAEDVPQAFQEMRDISTGTRIKNFFYHANMNTRADERLTPEQWALATDKLEYELHLDGQPRFIVEHEKEGRIHRHVIWSRVDADTMTAIGDSHNYRIHELVATELERDFGHEPTERALTRDRETTERPERNVKDWESFRAADSGIDPKAIKAELTALWQQSDSGPAFAVALEERGYILAKGDKRDFCIIDQAGDEHSLARRLAGVKAADVRARMADVEQDTLPSVAEARAIARNRPAPPADDTTEDSLLRSSEPAAVAESTSDPAWNRPETTGRWFSSVGGWESLSDTQRVAAQASYEKWLETRPTQRDRGSNEFSLADYVLYVRQRESEREKPEPLPLSEVPLSPLQAILRQRIEAERAQLEPFAMPARIPQPDEERPVFARIMQEAAQEAQAARIADTQQFQSDDAGSSWQRFSAWLSTMREHVAGFGQQVRDYWNDHFGATVAPETTAEPDEQPTNTITGRNAVAEPMQPRYNGPELGE